MPLCRRMDKLGIFLTQRCNFSCVYCCSAVGDDPPDKMTLEELRGLLAQAKEMGCRRIVISGAGEPFLDDLLLPLIELAARNGMAADVTTNGSMIDNRMAAWLWDHRVRIFFKLDAMDPAVRLKLTRESAPRPLAKISCRGRDFLVPAGLAALWVAGYARTWPLPLLSTATVITRWNIDEAAAVVDFAAQCGLGAYLEELLPLGRANDVPDIFPSSEVVAGLYQRVEGRMGILSRVWLRHRCAFELAPYFDVNGDVRLCFGAGDAVGNIRKNSLRDLYARQLSVKEKMGSISPLFNFGFTGFRECRVRRMLKGRCATTCKGS